MEPSQPSLPTGTVTFLFTDIEGSTRLWERDAVAMGRALERHNAILDSAIQEHGGMHFKTIGDAFQAAFAEPSAAVAAALAAQRALAAEPWLETGPLRVRMALHVSAAEPSPEGDYLAPGLNRLARLLATGHGGQVFLSNAARELAKDRLPPGASLVTLGRHRLRDLLDAEEVWQLVAADLPATFPPLKSMDAYPTNLPAQPTILFGRDDEIASLRQHLTAETTRLVTLVGPGGVGKTRLALAAAAESVEAFPDGIFFVALAGIEDAALFVPEIAAVLGVREGGGLSLQESLLAYLGDKRLLLALDNLEQLRPFEAAATSVARILDAAPGVRVLATSRAPLGLRAEREWPVAPLPAPRPDLKVFDEGNLTAVAANPAVALFVERAQAARPAWSLTPANARDVVEITRRLEGLPLAIELAAARIRILTPAEVLRRLGGALDLLATRGSDRPDRQQTLRAAIAWSHDLLSFEHQAGFRRLGVFSGGFTLEAAEALLAAAPDPWVDALDIVDVLVQQSLLRAEDDPGDGRRFRMLETVRAFALEALVAAGEDAAVRAAHAHWAETIARDASQHLLGRDSGEWLQRLDRDQDNFRAAIAWAIEHDASDIGMRLPEALWRFWEIRGYYAEARRWLERALERYVDAPPELRALTLDGLGNVAWRQGDLAAAARALSESLEIWRTLGESGALSRTLTNLGSVYEWQGQIDLAQSLQEEALALARASGDPRRIATTLNNLATVVWNKGDTARATALLEESVAIKRREGNLVGLASSLNNLGMLAAEAGDFDRAIAYMEETLAIDRQLDSPAGIADSLANLAGLMAATGNLARAAALDAEALALRQDLGDRYSVAFSLDGIAMTAARARLAEPAARLFGASAHLREQLGAPIPPSERHKYDEWVANSRAALGPAAFDQAWTAGSALPLDDAVAEALDVARQITHTTPGGS